MGILALAACVLVGVAVRAAEPELAAFPVDWQASADSPAGVAFLLDAPAGKGGFIRIDKGHLVRPDGSRFRIWGVNLTGKATVPSKEDAPRVAAHLARCGLNCMRFHFLDNPAPRGLIDGRRDDTRALDPEQLDRFDFFVAELKKRGIYSNINLNVGRKYKAGDGVPDHEYLGFAKALTYFNPRLIELQKEYARQLLTHRNPYTGNEYRHEPAVAIVELVNENSIVEAWFSGRLLGRNRQKNPGTWTDITERYERELTELYNQWLTKNLPADALASLRTAADVKEGPIPRLTPAEFGRAPSERFRTEASFYMDIERRYCDDMQRFLREELGVKPLLLGTSDHNHGKSGYPLLSSTARLDVVDGHVYWQHPHYITAESGKRQGFTIPNTPMVNAPLNCTVVQLARSAVAGKPYTVSEVNHPFPSEYACEGIPILTAYAAFHDWDGLFWYTMGHDDLLNSSSRNIGHFDLGPDPVKMSQLAAGALLFLRADVKAAQKSVDRSYTRTQVYESLRLKWAESPLFTPGFAPATLLVHGSRIASLDAAAAAEAYPAAPIEPFRSDTGELAWHGATEKRGLVVVDTPRSQALVGFCKENRQTTANLAAEIETPFCAITLSALDDRSIARGEKLLLTVTARVANSGMTWDEKRHSLDKWGTPPAQVEPVRGKIILRNLQDARAVTAQPLDGAGQPLGESLAATRTPDGWAVLLGTPATTWYVIGVQRCPSPR
jgi:hypothetical protein